MDMNSVATCVKWIAAILLILAGPAVLILAIPFTYGIAADACDAVGTPAALSVTIGVSLAALCWTRFRVREPAPARRTAAKPVG